MKMGFRLGIVLLFLSVGLVPHATVSIGRGTRIAGITSFGALGMTGVFLMLKSRAEDDVLAAKKKGDLAAQAKAEKMFGRYRILAYIAVTIALGTGALVLERIIPQVTSQANSQDVVVSDFTTAQVAQDVDPFDVFTERYESLRVPGLVIRRSSEGMALYALRAGDIEAFKGYCKDWSRCKRYQEYPPKELEKFPELPAGFSWDIYLYRGYSTPAFVLEEVKDSLDPKVYSDLRAYVELCTAERRSCIAAAESSSLPM